MNEPNLAIVWAKLTKGERELVVACLNKYGDVEHTAASAILANALDVCACLLKHKQSIRRIVDDLIRINRLFKESKQFKEFRRQQGRIQRTIGKVDTCLISSSIGTSSRRRIRNASCEP